MSDHQPTPLTPKKLKEQEATRVDEQTVMPPERATASENELTPAPLTPTDDWPIESIWSAYGRYCRAMSYLASDFTTVAERKVAIRERDIFRANAADYLASVLSSHGRLLEALKAAKPLAVRGLHWHQQRMADNPREDDAGKEDGLIATMEQVEEALALAEGREVSPHE